VYLDRVPNGEASKPMERKRALYLHVGELGHPGYQRSIFGKHNCSNDKSLPISLDVWLALAGELFVFGRGRSGSEALPWSNLTQGNSTNAAEL
jgi:hypothetical protein